MSLLSGIKVAELTCDRAGLLLTQMLADLGVEMVRVEPPDDPARDLPGSFVHLRGRRSIVLQPEVDASETVLQKLIAASDVLVTESRLDGSQLLSWSYDELAALNPRLIWCRLTGHGDDGPLVDAWSHDHLVAARFGVYDQPGWRRSGPTFLTAPVPSLGAAYLGVQGIGAALYMREKTGLGQEVSTSLLAGALAFQPNFIRTADNASITPGANVTSRQAYGYAPFYSIYECADGVSVQLGCLSTAFIERAMDVTGLRKIVTDLGYNSRERNGPVATHDEIIAAVSACLKSKPASEWAAIFEENDVPYAICEWTEDILDDPQVRHEGLVVTMEEPAIGSVEQVSTSVLFSNAPWQPPRPAPRPGQHSDEICRDLGLADSEIARLRQAGALL